MKALRTACDGLLVAARPGALAKRAVDELLVLLRELGDERAKHHEDLRRVDLAVVLDDVVLLEGDQVALQLARRARVAALQMVGHDLRHSAGEEVGVVGVEELAVEDLRERFGPGDRFVEAVQRRVARPQELGEVKRLHVQQLNLSDRIGPHGVRSDIPGRLCRAAPFSPEPDAQQASRR